MRFFIKNKIIKFVALFMIGIMGLFIANKVIFQHVHKLYDGTIIQHAHPYNKSNDSEPYKSHHHSDAEFLFFQNMEVLFLIVFLSLALNTLAIKKKAIFKITTDYSFLCIILHKGRAPPIS